MKLAVTGDLHWGHNRTGDAATRALAAELDGIAPDVFVIAGDVGEGRHSGPCLSLFSNLKAVRLLVPGNHDLWTREPPPASLDRYERRLPLIAREHGFHYLDAGPYLPEGGREAIVGSINWYDYSFADPSLLSEYPDAPAMYRAKLFPQARHNDGRYVHLGMSDEAFTTRIVQRFEEHLAALPPQVEQVIVVQHHPPVRELFYPQPVTSVLGRFWLAYTGNRRMQDVVLSDPRIRTIICGHTHAACTADVDGRRCLNIGGDYDFKRLLLLDTETGDEEWWEFVEAGE